MTREIGVPEVGRGGILVVGGYGVVGSEIVRLLRQRHPTLRIHVAGRNPERGKALAAELGAADAVRLDVREENPLAALAEPPALVVSAVNDPEDRVLLAAVRAGLPVVDITRWTARVHRAVLRLVGETLHAPVVLASAWMGGLAAIVAAAAARHVDPVECIEIHIRYALADRSGADSVAYMDRLAVPFETTQAGAERLTSPMTGGRSMRFPGGQRVRTYHIDTPEQATLPLVTGAATVTTRIGFDSASATAGLVALGRLGILRLLQGDRFTGLRRAMLHSSGEGGVASFVVQVAGAGGSVRGEVVDPDGQAHLTAVGALLGIEWALGTTGSDGPAPRVFFPEQHPEPQAALATARELGVGIALA